MLPIRFSLLCFLAFFSVQLSAQTKPQVEIQLITNDLIAEVNLNKDNFIAWAKILTQQVDSSFAGDTTGRDVMMLITLHAGSNPDISIHARPAYKPEILTRITNSFSAVPPFRSELVDYSFVYLIRTGKGCSDPKAPFVPAYTDPNDKRRSEFQKANLEEKKNLLRNWARSEVIPVLQILEEKVDPKFKGVRFAGTLLTKEAVASGRYARTDSLSDYWRGVMEMSPGNESITLSKMMLYVASDEFDFVKEYCELLRPFTHEKVLATYYISELIWRLDEFSKELKGRVEKGIEQHDKGNYTGALSVYNRILNEYPNSAWVNYEHYFSTSSMHMAETKDSVSAKMDWEKAKPRIYACDPLYPVCPRASTGKEGYLLFRRMEVSNLFRKKDDFARDMMELGDIATDLGVYGYAAEVYWLCFSRLKKEDIHNKEMLPYFLYVLDKLGDQEIRKNFQGDFQKEFKRIDKERKKRMEESPYYKAFKVKE